MSKAKSLHVPCWLWRVSPGVWVPREDRRLYEKPSAMASLSVMSSCPVGLFTSVVTNWPASPPLRFRDDDGGCRQPSRASRPPDRRRGANARNLRSENQERSPAYAPSE